MSSDGQPATRHPDQAQQRPGQGHHEGDRHEEQGPPAPVPEALVDGADLVERQPRRHDGQDGPRPSLAGVAHRGALVHDEGPHEELGPRPPRGEVHLVLEGEEREDMGRDRAPGQELAEEHESQRTASPATIQTHQGMRAGLVATVSAPRPCALAAADPAPEKASYFTSPRDEARDSPPPARRGALLGSPASARHGRRPLTLAVRSRHAPLRHRAGPGSRDCTARKREESRGMEAGRWRWWRVWSRWRSAPASCRGSSR